MSLILSTESAGPVPMTTQPTLTEDTEEKQPDVENDNDQHLSKEGMNDVVVVKHVYSAVGLYPVSVSIKNPFNSGESWLCPEITVVPADSPQPECTTFAIRSSDGQTVDAPIQTNRSDSLTVTFEHELDCGELKTEIDYSMSASWQTSENSWRPELNVCIAPQRENVFGMVDIV